MAFSNEWERAMVSAVRFPVSAEAIPLERRMGQLVKRLVRAPDMGTFARIAAEFLEDEGLANVLVGWRIAALDAQVHDASIIQEGDHELALRAREGSSWAVDETRQRIACVIYADPGRYEFSVVCDGRNDSRPRIEALAELLGPLAETMFEKCHIADAMLQRAHSEQLQSALFAIADMASSEMDLGDMLTELHAIVGRFMYAENFYIALYDEQQDALRFIYLKDTTDPVVRDANEFIPMSVMQGGLTWHVIRDGKPLMGTLDEIDAQLERPARDIGIDCYDWLGVPAIVGDVVRGVLVVQSYVERPRYTPGDQALLTYVGSHIVTAVDRKLAKEELERRVAQRTEELEHSVRLQKALFRIAELSHTARNLEAFYGAVHQVVGEFFDARNFYIAMLSHDGKMLEFPYFVDQFDTTPISRPVGLGITEYGMRYGKPLKLDMRDPDDIAMVEELDRRNELRVTGKDCVEIGRAHV